MYADPRTARTRRARALAEAYQRRRLRKPAVQVTAMQGGAGLLIVLVRVLSVPAVLIAAEELWPAVLVYAGGGVVALLARVPVRQSLDAAVRRRGEIAAAQGGIR